MTTNTTKLSDSEYKQLGRMLHGQHPELARQLLLASQPIMEDPTLISRVRAVLENMWGSNFSSKRDRIDRDRLLILITVRLFDPVGFNGFRKYMAHGLREKLAAELNYSPTRISNLYGEARNFLLFYKPFKIKAISTFDEINFQYSGFQKAPGSEQFLN